MTLTNALKVKNRLVGQLKKLQMDIQVHNSTCKEREIDIAELWEKLNDTTEKLIDLKTKIAIKTAKISSKLIRLAEEKSKLEFYNILPTKTGEETSVVSYGSNATKTEIWNSFITETKKRELIAKSEEEIAYLQDCIDEFNATTIIE